MPEYSIHFIGPSREVVREPQVENLVDDSAALMRAAQLTSEASAAEVWCGHRLVCAIPFRAAVRSAGIRQFPPDSRIGDARDFPRPRDVAGTR
jgi:hypothetical protein